MTRPPRSLLPAQPPAHPRRTLARATLCGLLVLGACADEPSESEPQRRLLIVGWDGATFDLIDPLIEAGRMPVLAGLIKRGRSALLESSRVPISSAAWVGACTGQHPGETGVYDFFERVEGSYEVQVIDARTNLCPPLWRILSGRGFTVNVFGVPITWPPEPVRGHLAAGMLSPPSEAWAWPPEYTGELRDQGLMPDVGVWTKMRSVKPRQLLARVEKQLVIKERVVLDLVRRQDWTLSMVVFKSLDVLSHQLYDGRTEGVIPDLLEQLDAVLGRMIEAAGPETDVIVMSDHGFGTYPRTFNLYPWLVQTGYAVQAGTEPITRPSWSPLVTFEAESERLRLERLDLTRTRVLATNTECEGNFGSLRLNLAGREPTGVVAPDGADALLAEIEAALRTIQVEGRPLVTRFWRGAQLYPGAANGAVPDLIFETLPDWQVIASAAGAALVHNEQPRPDHRLDGIFVAAGPSIAASVARDAATGGERVRWSVFDLAPTALHLLGQAGYEEMSGSSHPELLREARPVRRIPRASDPTYRAPDQAWTELSEEQRQAQIDQLKALGYADGQDD